MHYTGSMVHIRQRWLEYALLISITVFLVLKFWFFAPRFSDGAIYAYLGQLVMEGSIPYRDFFYSSPPALLYIFGIVGLVFNWQWWSWAALPILLSVVDALLLFWIGRRLWSNWAGAVVAITYLFSFATVATTDFATDVHFVVTALLLAVLAQMRGRSVVAGLLLALAVLIKLYAVIIVGPYVLWLLWQERQAVWRVLAAFSGAIAMVVVVLWLATGGEFYQSIILNNLGRGVGIPKERLLPFIFWHDPWLLLGLLMPVAVRRLPPAWILLLAGTALGFLMVYPDVYYLYFKMAAPWLALLIAWGSFELYQEYGRGVGVALLLILAVASAYTIVRYEQDHARASVILSFDDIIKYVQETTTPEDVLYGDFDVAPLVALGSQRNIYNDLADTNVKFFLNTTFSIEERVEELVAVRVPVMVTKAIVEDKHVLGGYEQTLPRSFVAQYCRVGDIFPNPTLPAEARQSGGQALVVWRCNY